MKTIYPLKTNFCLDEDKGFIQDQIQERCQSEDFYTYAKGYDLIKEVKGRAGVPKPQEQQLSYLW